MNISAISKTLFGSAAPADATTTGTGTSSTGATSTGATSTLNTSANATISTTDFMKLLSAEMADQDPLQPMDPTQTMTQLAQFSNLQQTNVIAQNQSLATAAGYIGAQVTIPGVGTAAATTGTVTGVDTSQVASGGVPQLILSGTATEYPISSVSQVALPSSATTTASSNPTTSSVTPSSSANSSNSTH